MSETSGQPASGRPREPYPKMILVCVGITLVLLGLIAGALALDFAQRSQSRNQVTPAPFSAPVQPEPAD